ncbi:PREDICTED: acyl-coenzyme A amino acid N-acyltransferase 1-like [Nanorana parkeri]|uniref:acyl-coenzyme A amino acid N-acyltransferase 1-like n=1 Tax=Nanorana parkeri TaxID=125878 RepID=UPI0008542D4A|nr:PREDICTED: acyl-coenzyme A amino acid N-acyltransferase 1-like [Nanorana parkeri]
MIGLTVSPEVALADEPVKIQAWGLRPQELITLRAWLKDEKGEIFYSRAFYMTDEEGKVDLEHTPATGGDFQGVHPMGLFWALKPVTPFLRLLKRDVIGSPFYVHLELYRHLEITPSPKDIPTIIKVVQRWYASPRVQRVQIREGRVRGTLFLPPGEGPFPGVIDIPGRIHGLIEFKSSLLASRGFASLALAYFAYEDLPSQLENIDLKYFEEAVQWLSNHPKVSGAGVGIISFSKGVEPALAMGVYLPQVAATICVNGTNAINGEALSYGDIIFPAIPYQAERILTTDRGTILVYELMGDPRKPEYHNSIIPVERARGPILFLVGENDQVYNSLFFAKEVLARAHKYGKQDVYLRSYPGAGHLLEPPGLPHCSVSRVHLLPLPLNFGGELVSHCRAQESCWKEILDFLRKNIPCSRQNKL